MKGGGKFGDCATFNAIEHSKMTVEVNEDTLLKAIGKGYCFSFSDGLFVVTKPNGKLIDECYQQTMIKLILSQLDYSVFQYVSYEAKRYPVTAKKYKDGICLYFTEYLTGEHIAAFFNASIRYQRASKAKNVKRGGNLPKGRFTPVAGGNFIKLWRKLGISEPKSKTEYYERMGKLKPFYLVGDVVEKDKGLRVSETKTIEPLSLSCDEIKSLLLSDNLPINNRQLPDKKPLRVTDKELDQNLIKPEIETDFTTDTNNHSNKVKSTQVTVGLSNTPLDNYISDEEVDQWLEDYNN